MKDKFASTKKKIYTKLGTSSKRQGFVVRNYLTEKSKKKNSNKAGFFYEI